MSYITPPSSFVSAPYLEIEVSDILENKKSTVHALIDTGFDGELLIPMNLYRDLNLGSFESNTERTISAETVTGEKFHLRSSVGNIRLLKSDLTIIATIDTYIKIDEIIIGRAFLENFQLILDGCKKEVLIDLCNN